MSQWVHTKKYKGKIFNGKYERRANKQRIFVLSSGAIEKEFESHEAAKRNDGKGNYFKKVK